MASLTGIPCRIRRPSLIDRIPWGSLLPPLRKSPGFGDFIAIGKTAPVHIHSKSLRALRELRGLNALEVAERVGCAVGVVVRAEMGLQLPASRAEQARLASAYGLHPREFVRMALDEAERRERGKTR
jgi:hypothetical protein